MESIGPIEAFQLRPNGRNRNAESVSDLLIPEIAGYQIKYLRLARRDAHTPNSSRIPACRHLGHPPGPNPMPRWFDDM
jgi:hypothetical protein